MGKKIITEGVNLNEDLIGKFLDEYSVINSLKPKRIYKYRLFLGKISQWLGKSLEDANKDDLIKVLRAIQESELSENSRIDAIKILKTFAKYKGWDVSWIKAKTPQTKVDASQLLDADDIVKMVKAAKSARDRAIVMLLYEGAYRFSEFNNTTLDSLSFKNDYVDVTIRISKTTPRTLSLVVSKPFLEQYIQEEHQFNKDKKSYLFYGRDFNTKGKVNDPNPYKKMSHTALLALIKEIAKKAGIQKKVWLHLARHSRLSYLCQYIKESELRIFAGWSGSSRMPSTYLHLAHEDVSRSYLGNVLGQDKNGKEPQDTRIKSERCKQCAQANFVSDKLCLRCNAVIEPKLRNVIEIENQIAEFLSLPEIRELAKKFLMSK